jgi:hypothetical protein
MGHFLFVRDQGTGQVLHEECLSPDDTVHPFGDPYWTHVGTRYRELERRFPPPAAMVVECMASSVSKFISNHPEYGPIVGADS